MDDKTSLGILLEKIFVMKITDSDCKFILINPLTWLIIILLFLSTPIICMVTDIKADECIYSIVDAIVESFKKENK